MDTKGVRQNGTEWVCDNSAPDGQREVPYYELTTISAADAAEALGLRTLGRRENSDNVVAVLGTGGVKFRCVAA